MAKKAVRVRIVGLVHGVFFRASLAQLAAEHGVTGWVRNMPDGSVLAHLEGEERKISVMLQWAKQGPPRARVDSVRVETVPSRNSRVFRIEG